MPGGRGHPALHHPHEVRQSKAEHVSRTVAAVAHPGIEEEACCRVLFGYAVAAHDFEGAFRVSDGHVDGHGFSSRREDTGGDRVTAVVLALFWLWTGVVFHGQEFALLNWAAPACAALFVLQALLVLWTGVVRGRLQLRLSGGIRGAVGGLLVALAIAGYPLFDHFAGQGWPAVRLFPVAPAPLAVFTLGMLLFARPRPPLHLVAIPLLWTLIHGWVAYEVALPVELVAPAAGVLATGVALIRPRTPSERGA